MLDRCRWCCTICLILCQVCFHVKWLPVLEFRRASGESFLKETKDSIAHLCPAANNPDRTTCKLMERGFLLSVFCVNTSLKQPYPLEPLCCISYCITMTSRYFETLWRSLNINHCAMALGLWPTHAGGLLNWVKTLDLSPV